MTTATKKTLSLSIKLAIIGLAYWFIYRAVSNKAELNEFKGLLSHVSGNRVAITMSAVGVLMLVNWVLEAFKWKYLTRKLQRMTVWRSIEAVFCGLTWAIFTPNRLGEYGGRVLFLPPNKRVYGVFVMGVGQFGQGTVTNVVGITAILWFLYTFIHLNTWLMALIAIVGITLMLFLLTCYFNIKWVASWFGRISFLKKYNRFFEIIGRYKKGHLLKVMLFCVARFSVFSFQYYLVIHLLVPNLAAFPVMMMVFNNFVVQSVLPTLDILDVGLRGMTASTFFGYITTQQIAVIAAVSSIWFTNLIIPAILGSVFVLKIRFFDRSV